MGSINYNCGLKSYFTPTRPWIWISSPGYKPKNLRFNKRYVSCIIYISTSLARSLARSDEPNERDKKKVSFRFNIPANANTPIVSAGGKWISSHFILYLSHFISFFHSLAPPPLIWKMCTPRIHFFFSSYSLLFIKFSRPRRELTILYNILP